MNTNPKALVEIFHLFFLRQFNSQIEANLYAIKGGCNLRLFFNSFRYSEDLDLDICTIAPKTLENKVNKILLSPSLLKLLQPYNINQLNFSTHKQTTTTQRWKIQLEVENRGIPYHTKIEFSHRNGKINAELSALDTQLCQMYRLPPMRLSHYSLIDALTQKISALAHRSVTQARDIFDIYHLLHTGEPKLFIDKTILDKAKENLISIDFNDYISQVVNFLEPEEQDRYSKKACWSDIAKKVLQYLNELDQ